MSFPLAPEWVALTCDTWSFYILQGRKRAGIKALASADWILGTCKGLPKSRVHTACFEMKGQPFYGWFVDGSGHKSQARFERAFLQALAEKADRSQMKRISVEFGS